MTCLLIIATSSNTPFLLIYTTLHQPEPVASPHALFLSIQTNTPALASRLPHKMYFSSSGGSYSASPHPPRQEAAHTADARIQDLEVGTPSEGELMLVPKLGLGP